MKTRSVVVLAAVAVLLAAVTPGCPAQAAKLKPGDLTIRTIQSRLRRAPDYNVSGASLGGQGSAANQPWLHIEVEFENASDWLDEVAVKYFVLVRDRQPRMFTGETVHVDVRPKTRSYSAMFVPPNTIDRYGRGKVETVAVQLFAQGVRADQASDPPASDRWWERHTPITGHLLRPRDTPWFTVAHERYEAEKIGP